MPEYKVIKKGRIRARSDVPVKAVSYVIARGDEGCFILLKLRSKSKAALNAVSLTVSEYDADGTLLRTVSAEQDSLEEEGRFVLPQLIEADEGCTEIKVEVQRAVYGDYCYERKGAAAVLEYNGCEYQPPVYDASARKNKFKNGNTIVAKRRFTSPILLSVLGIVIFICLVLFTLDQISCYSSDETASFRESDVTYEFVYDQDMNIGLMATGYSGLTGAVTIPATIDGYNVIAVETQAFSGDTSITRVTIKAQAIIEQNAFYGCTSLTSVTANYVTAVGNGAFYGCTSLSSVSLGAAETISENAFYGCTSLTTIDLSNAEYIGSSAFYGCTSLQQAYIGASSDSLVMGNYVFANCTKLQYFAISCDTAYSKTGSILSGCTNLTSIILNNLYTSSSDDEITLVNLIGSTAAKNAFTVTIDHLGSIPSSFCRGLNVSTLHVNTLDSTVIGQNAFRECAYLTSLSLPVSITSVYEYAFYNSAISSFDFTNTTYIGNSAFYGCSYLTSAALYSSTLTIGASAFYNSGLISVTIYDVSNIGTNAFYLCTSLTNIYNYSGTQLYAGNTTYGYLTYYTNTRYVHNYNS